MEIVIKIPEETYKECQGNTYFSDTGGQLFDVVKNGVVLPKGHGRLIDADELKFEKCTLATDSSVSYYLVDKEVVENAPTIIEADRGDKE